MIIEELGKYYGTQQKMADAVGCSQTLVWRWLNKKAEIPVHFALKIEKLTNGKFKAVDLCPRLAELEGISPQQSDTPTTHTPQRSRRNEQPID